MQFRNLWRFDFRLYIFSKNRIEFFEKLNEENMKISLVLLIICYTLENNQKTTLKKEL
jgi:hypothetical protein